MSPVRIQRKRTKGWRMPEGAIYVGRPTEWGNTWKVGDIIVDRGPRYYGRRYVFIDAHLAVEVFRKWVLQDVISNDSRMFRKRVRAVLAGKDLACWCPLDQPCHADVLLDIANRPQP